MHFKVGMTCQGCAGAVTRILKKIDGNKWIAMKWLIYTIYCWIILSGVHDVATNVDAKTVEVQCEDGVNSQLLLDSLQKWSATSGKSVELVN